MQKKAASIIEMLICALLWSIGGIFIKLLPWNGFAVASLRSLVAGLTIGAYMLIARRRFVMNRKVLLSGILTGCVYICFVCANKLTTAANAIVLQFTSPVFIVIISALFLGKRIRRTDAAAVVLTLLGVALVFFDQLKGGYLAGNIVAIASGLFMAGMYVCVGNLEEDERYSAICTGQAFTFLAGLPSVFITKPELTVTTVACVLILGIFQLGISYVLYVRAARNCPPLACCLLGGLEPLLNPVWVMLFDGETPGPLALIGGLIVIAAVTLWCAFADRLEAARAENNS